MLDHIEYTSPQIDGNKRFFNNGSNLGLITPKNLFGYTTMGCPSPLNNNINTTTGNISSSSKLQIRRQQVRREQSVDMKEKIKQNMQDLEQKMVINKQIRDEPLKRSVQTCQNSYNQTLDDPIVTSFGFKKNEEIDTINEDLKEDLRNSGIIPEDLDKKPAKLSKVNSFVQLLRHRSLNNSKDDIQIADNNELEDNTPSMAQKPPSEQLQKIQYSDLHFIV